MKMPELLHLHFDYVDPACFLLERELRRREDSGLYPLVLEPFEIRPPPMELLDPHDKEWSFHWEAMAAEARSFGHQLATPWIVPWTRKAHELAAQAREEGCFLEIHQAIFRAFLLEGKDIGRVDILVALAREHGLDQSTVKPVLDVDRHTDSVRECRERGLALGVTTVPTLRWRGRILEGYPEPGVLESFLASREDPQEP
jgi:predicted DsbA family dithiol-disulfide isomerase